MKTLQIQPAARASMRATLRRTCAAVTNLRKRIDPRASLAVASAATFLLFIALGLTSAPGIIACSITAAAALAVTPTPSAQEGGEL